MSILTILMVGVAMIVYFARLFTVPQAQTGPKFVSVILNSGVSNVKEFEVYGDTCTCMIRTLRIVCNMAGVQH